MVLLKACHTLSPAYRLTLWLAPSPRPGPPSLSVCPHRLGSLEGRAEDHVMSQLHEGLARSREGQTQDEERAPASGPPGVTRKLRGLPHGPRASRTPAPGPGSFKKSRRLAGLPGSSPVHPLLNGRYFLWEAGVALGHLGTAGETRPAPDLGGGPALLLTSPQEWGGGHRRRPPGFRSPVPRGGTATTESLRPDLTGGFSLPCLLRAPPSATHAPADACGSRSV